MNFATTVYSIALGLCCLFALAGSQAVYAAPAQKNTKPAAAKPKKQEPAKKAAVKKPAAATKPETRKTAKTAKTDKNTVKPKAAAKQPETRSGSRKPATVQAAPSRAAAKKPAAPKPRAAAADPLSHIINNRQTAPQAPAAPAAPPAPQTARHDEDALGALIRNRTPAPTAAAKPPAAKPAPASPPRASATADNTPITKGDADELIRNAMGLLGVAYRFGGTSASTGFDCSGFMQHVFRKTFAVNLPRTSAEQARVGIHVSRSALQPGDMVFFRTAGKRISHVGMYVGNNRFIHAPRTGKSIEITSLSNKYWSSRYATARRVKRNNAGRFTR